MPQHANFYETINEARMRLKDTIVMYDGVPYYVIDVTDHEDGRFRVYMDKLGKGAVGRSLYGGSFPHPGDYYPGGVRAKYDEFLEKNPDLGFTRKLAKSRHFNKFRPFPLGNVNMGGAVVYTERSPTRNMHQGLLQDAVVATKVSASPSRNQRSKRGRASLLASLAADQAGFGDFAVDVFSSDFYSMLVGDYPSFQEVVDNLRDPLVLNTGCAFHRDWSVLRGPLDILILCYKHEGIGIITQDNSVSIGSNYQYLLESINELGVFNNVTVTEVKTYNG